MSSPLGSVQDPLRNAATSEESSVPLSVAEIAGKCIHCRQCLTDCLFLTQHGTPGQLARSYSQKKADLYLLAFSCSLCNLCHQTCPLNLDPGQMFLDLRREAVRLHHWNHRKHRRLLIYESLGGSGLFRYLSLPPGGTSVFFPGCTLPGVRPEHTLELYRYLKKLDPAMGIMLDCCNKPSHDLGRQQFFENRLKTLTELLASKGVRNIITGCPNCYKAFSLNQNDFSIKTVYNIMADQGFISSRTFQNMNCTIHDPCSIRFEQEIHQAVRTITTNTGVRLLEMKHNRESTLCCGEGGAAGCMEGRYAAGWSEKRHNEMNGLPLITYCAGCTRMLQHHGQVHHIVDLLFPETGPDHTTPRRINSFTAWLNRLKLKSTLKRLAGVYT